MFIGFLFEFADLACKSLKFVLQAGILLLEIWLDGPLSIAPKITTSTHLAPTWEAAPWIWPT
jgi:hypothetical protein